MSKNPDVNYAQYVHAFKDKSGKVRFAVGIKLKDGAYASPTGYTERQTTGIPWRIFKSVDEMGGWLSKRSALRRAQYLFGQINLPPFPPGLGYRDVQEICCYPIKKKEQDDQAFDPG